MKVSTNSWHYRLLNYMNSDDYPPNNLCGYFRDLIGILLLLPFIYSFVVISRMWESEPDTGIVKFVVSCIFVIATTGTFFYLAAIDELGFWLVREECCTDGNPHFVYSTTDGLIVTGLLLILIGGTLQGMIWGVVGFIFGAVTVVEGLVSRIHIKKPDGGSANIVVEYVKAKKNRYCPRIEFIEEHEKS